MSSGLLSLKWNNHRTTFFHVLSTIRSKDSYCDVTLACEGRFYALHKFVLATCSEYFEQIFQKTQCKHPIIVLKDISFEDLEALLNYMYIGEVNVVQEKLSGLIKAAECLRIKGLAVPDEEDSLLTKEDATRGQQHTAKRSQRNEDSPRAKRRRRNTSSDGVTEDASDLDKSLDSSRSKTSNQQCNSLYKRNLSHNNDDRGLSQENDNEVSRLSHSSISPTISRDFNDDTDAIEQTDHLLDVKKEPFESEVVSVSPETPFSPDTKEGILGVVMEDDAGNIIDNSFEDLQGRPVGESPSNYSQDALWETEGSGSYETVEDASGASVHLYPGKPESNSGVLHHPLHSTSCNTFKNPYITSPSDDLSTPSTSDPTSAPKTNSKSHLSSETTSSLSSDGAISRDANVVLTAKHQDLDNAFDWSGLMELHSEGSGSAHLNLSREGTFTSKKWQCSICPYTVDRAKKLEIHMRKHTGEKPYACPHCSYMASQRSNLNRHMLKHSETQLLRCPFCPYLTEVQHVLDSHVMNHQDQ